MSLSSRWARFSDRHRRALLVATAVTAIAGGIGTARLYGDLRPDMTALLPASSPSAMDLREVTRRVGGFSELTVVVHGSDAGTLVLFADDLADRLAAAPRDLVKWVEYRADAARDFYQRRLLLFAEEAQLRELRDTLRDRVAWEKASARGRARGPAPDVEGLVERLTEAGGHELRRFPQGYYLGEVPGREPGQKVTALAMLVRLAGSPDDYEHVEAMARLVASEVDALDPGSYAPTLEVSYAGYVASAILEHDALAEDLVWATVLVLLSVTAVVAVYNRTWKAVPAVGFPLMAGALATFGIAELWVGHLNSNTAFLGSIVVGNGINVGLILFARYLEERRHGRPPLEAMETALSATWLATLTAAFAAGAAYASLMATDFRGFNQFGLIGGVGMAFSWAFSYLVTPALVLAWERLAPIPRAGQRPDRAIFTKAVSHAVDRAPRVTVLAALAVTAISLVFIHRFSRDPFEYDFKHLRNLAGLEEGGPAWWDERVDALFGDHLTPTALLAQDEAEAREIARRLEAHKARTPDTAFGPVLSIASLVPERQEEKLPLVREIAALATRENLAFLPPDRRMRVEAVLPPPDLRPFTAADLPEEVRRTLTEVDGRVGTAVLVYPSLRVDVWNGRDVMRYAEEIRSIELPRADVPIASSQLVFADVLYAIARDGPRATLLSLGGVSLIVLVAFGLGKRSVRSLADAAWVLASLALGVVWFMGLAGALDLRLNMLNFIAFPITFGIGVDYATNVFQRRRIDHARSIADVIRTTGGAVTLCSLTTIIGYSSLLVARNQALISFGLLAVLGELACLAAALLALPAVLRWRELRAEARARRSRA